MRHATPTTVRFWVWANAGWVRLALRDGQRLRHDEAYSHDEGYHREQTEWARFGSTVVRTTDADGRDCDGRLEQHDVSECAIDRLRASGGNGEPECPDWVRLRYPHSFQRDYTAEAAGY